MNGMTIYVFTLITALFILFSWVVFRVIKNAKRAHQPIFDVNPVLRCIICLVLLVIAFYEIYTVIQAINQGSIRVVLGGKYSRTHGFTIHHAQNPYGFWEAICFYGYGALVFVWLSLAEVFLTIQRRKHPKAHRQHEF